MTEPLDLSALLATAKSALATIETGNVSREQLHAARAALSALIAALPDPNLCTADEAAELLAPFASAFTSDAARAAVLGVLMRDKAGGLAILHALPKPIVENQNAKPDAAAILAADYANRFSHDGAGDAFRERMLALLETDEAAARAILDGTPPVPGWKPPADEQPPAPIHDPVRYAREQQGPAAANARAAEAKRLIAELRKSGDHRYADFTSAWNEIKRRHPELFQ